MIENSTPLVSICCIAYNHAPFIKKCLDGILMQNTNFSFEVLIHDDASTDGTDAIINEYVCKYPHIIFPIFEKENQYSNGYKSIMDLTFNYSRAKGKYIATCEGDDYWTDPFKLQKQIDFLEENPDYSVCFHRCIILNQETAEFREDGCGVYLSNDMDGVDINTDMFLRHWVTQPLTMVHRASINTYRREYRYYRDLHTIYNLLQNGKCRLMNFCGGVYREHIGGIDSKIPLPQQQINAINVAKELYDIHDSKELKDNLIRIYDWVIEDKSFTPIKTIALIHQRFILSHSFKKMSKQFLRLFFLH